MHQADAICKYYEAMEPCDMVHKVETFHIGNKNDNI